MPPDEVQTHVTGRKQPRSRRRTVILWGACGALGTIAAAVILRVPENKPPEKVEKHPPALVDSWIQMYPPTRTPDTMTLAADGTILGSTAGLDDIGWSYARWQVGAELMPGGFCVGDSAHFYCQGYALFGDTLALASGKRAVFLRARAATDGGASWASARRRIDDVVQSPRPGAAVPAPATVSRP